MDWYAHPKLLTFKLTKLPPNYPEGFIFPSGITPNTADYIDRGWYAREIALRVQPSAKHTRVRSCAVLALTHACRARCVSHRACAAGAFVSRPSAACAR